MRTKLFFTSLLVLIILRSVNPAIFGMPVNPVSNQNPVGQLEIKLKSQYAAIEKLFAAPPNSREVPRSTYGRLLREWQDDLAQSFGRAAATVEDILALNPPNREMWQERLETLRLYSQPVSSPQQRTVYGSGEVQQSARILETPLAVYADEARAAKIHGAVRLRLVLASDRTVKYVFPIKSLGHGLTESAMAAARQIKFEPAARNGQPASQFETFVYEFEKGQSQKPYIPGTVF
jgi:TonB family protein